MDTRDQLRRLRIAANKTTSQLADDLGMSQGAISAIENKHHGTRLDVVERWAQACDQVLTFAPPSDPLQPAASGLTIPDRALLARLALALRNANPAERGMLESMATTLETAVSVRVRSSR